MASSGAMMAQTFSFIIPPSPATGTAHFKKEIRFSLRLFKVRKGRKRPKSPKLVFEPYSQYSAGRARPPAGHFC
jgi:hypothetical protein